MPRESNPGEPLEAILFVHGTFAYDDIEKGSHWWQRDSAFANDLASRLASLEPGARAVPVPPGKRFSYFPPWWKASLSWCLPRLFPTSPAGPTLHRLPTFLAGS
jgi:hypothetical protein